MRHGSPLLDPPDSHDSRERAEALHDMLQSLGWQIAARPAMVERAAHIERRIAAGKNLDLEEIRMLQVEWNLLRMMLDRAEDFFKNKRGTE